MTEVRGLGGIHVNMGIGVGVEVRVRGHHEREGVRGWVGSKLLFRFGLRLV